LVNIKNNATLVELPLMLRRTPYDPVHEFHISTRCTGKIRWSIFQRFCSINSVGYMSSRYGKFIWMCLLMQLTSQCVESVDFCKKSLESQFYSFFKFFYYFHPESWKKLQPYESTT